MVQPRNKLEGDFFTSHKQKTCKFYFYPKISQQCVKSYLYVCKLNSKYTPYITTTKLWAQITQWLPMRTKLFQLQNELNTKIKAKF
jgi:hypothetical protein